MSEPGIRKKDGYDFEAMYVVRRVQTIDGVTHVTATLDYDPQVRISVCASENTAYGFETVADVAVHFTIGRQPSYVEAGDVVKVQSASMPAATPSRTRLNYDDR